MSFVVFCELSPITAPILERSNELCADDDCPRLQLRAIDDHSWYSIREILLSKDSLMLSLEIVFISRHSGSCTDSPLLLVWRRIARSSRGQMHPKKGMSGQTTLVVFFSECFVSSHDGDWCLVILKSWARRVARLIDEWSVHCPSTFCDRHSSLVGRCRSIALKGILNFIASYLRSLRSTRQ